MSGDIDARISHLLNERRNTLLGVQILFAGLIAAPFASNFSAIERREELVFLFAIGCAALASLCLITPAQFHRVACGALPRTSTVLTGRIFGTAGTVFLALAVTGVVFLVFELAESFALAGIAAGAVGGLAVVLWFVMPLFARATGRY